MKNSTVCDGKSTREAMPGFPIGGKPIRRLVNMIYWYGWGDDEDFDIRVVRRILGLPGESKHDKWFMKKRPDPCAAFVGNMAQIIEALGSRDFGEVIAEHDRLLDVQAEEDRSKRLKAMQPWLRVPAFSAEPDDICPF